MFLTGFSNSVHCSRIHLSLHIFALGMKFFYDSVISPSCCCRTCQFLFFNLSVYHWDQVFHLTSMKLVSLFLCIQDTFLQFYRLRFKKMVCKYSGSETGMRSISLSFQSDTGSNYEISSLYRKLELNRLRWNNKQPEICRWHRLDSRYRRASTATYHSCTQLKSYFLDWR